MKEERFPRTRKPLRGRRLWVAEGHRGAEGKAERLLHRGSVPSSTHQPERLVCSPARVGGAGSLGSGFGHRERTGAGSVNTA